MPIYEYRCEECGEIFEVRASLQQKIAGLQPECPRCHGRKAAQQFRSLNVIHAGRTGNTLPAFGCCSPDRQGGC
jgi:putative FmdB family regulatory protein